MSDEPLEPLPDDLRELLAGEGRLVAGPPATAQEALLARVHQTVGLPMVDAPGGHGPAPTIDARTSPGSPGGLGFGWRAMTLSAMVGALGGAAVTSVVMRRREAITRPHVDAVAPSPPRSTSPPVTPAARVEAPPREAVTTAVADASRGGEPDARPARAQAGRDEGAATPIEREALEAARELLLRGRPGEARAALEGLERRFPRGHFAEEREALMVVALLRSGRAEEARARGQRFLAQYPESLQRSRVAREIAVHERP